MVVLGNSGEEQDARVCVGEITAAHGLNGEFCVRSFTAEPHAIAAYGPVAAGSGGRDLRIEIVGEKKDVLIVRAEGIADRTAAEALRGLRLYINRAALPEPDEDEYYYADLVGLTAMMHAANGSPLGQIIAVHDFGAGPVLEIERTPAPTILVPFTRVAVAEVDLAHRRIVVAALPGLIAPDVVAEEGSERSQAPTGLAPP